MYNIAIATALLVSFGAGAGLMHIKLDSQVTCTVPAVVMTTPPPVTDFNMQKMLTPTRIPLDGYRTY